MKDKTYTDLKNAIVDYDTGEIHMFCVERGVGRHYEVGGKDFSPGTLVKLVEFESDKLKERFENFMVQTEEKGIEYETEINIPPRTIRAMIRDLIPNFVVHI